MLLNSHISAYTRCLAEKVCGLERSTWGTSQGEDKLGARGPRDKILNTKVARRANIPPWLRPGVQPSRAPCIRADLQAIQSWPLPDLLRRWVFSKLVSFASPYSGMPLNALKGVLLGQGQDVLKHGTSGALQLHRTSPAPHTQLRLHPHISIRF